MKGTYLALAGRIRQELREIAHVVARAESGWKRAKLTSDDYYADAVALNLHGFYAGVERLFELIAQELDRAKPSGSDWHQALLRQMTAEIPQVRPAVLLPATRDRLDRYRGFRHVVRQVYTFNLDPEQIEALVASLQETFESVQTDLLTFADFLERLAKTSGSSKQE
jgi:hypothetical protein